MPFLNMGRLLILGGIFLILLGILVTLCHHIPFLGRLPGDILIQKERFQFFFPVMTCLLISALLTLIINLIIRLR